MKLKLLLLLPLASGAFSQSPTTPPPIVRIFSMPGVGSDLRYRNYANAGGTVDIIGLSAATGAPETWWIEMHPNFASIESLDQAMSNATYANLPNDSRGMIAVLQPGWSYRPEEAVRGLPKARYISVTIIRIRPGTDAGLGGLVGLHKAASDAVNSDRPDMFYHVVSGDDSGTYIVLSPLASMRVLDEGAAAANPGADSKTAEIETSREHYLFRVEPRLSYVSTGFANGDPSFWRP